MRHEKHCAAPRFFAVSLILILALSLASCGGSGGSGADTSVETGDSYGVINGGADMGSGGETGSALPVTPSAENPSRPYGDDVKLILRAALELQATDFEEAAAGLHRLAADYDGYFESSDVQIGDYGDSSRRSGYYSIRVPQKHYDGFLRAAESVCHVSRKHESAEDVGSQYFDAESRLKTLRSKQDRLLAFIDNAENMEEIIQLENALGDVQYQIDQYASELSRYDSLIDYSTIDVTLHQVSRLTSSVSDETSFGTRLAAAFREGMLGARDVLAVLVVSCAYLAVPLGIILVVLCMVFFIRRRLKKGGHSLFKRGPGALKVKKVSGPKKNKNEETDRQ